MKNEALKCISHAAELRHARINAIDGERFGLVSSDGTRYWLKPALGCLLQPAIGDRVLISIEGDDGFILSVLERVQTQPARLQFEGDLSLSVPGGALSIQTRDGLAINAGELLSIEAETGVAQLSQMHLQLHTFQVCGERFDSHWTERSDTIMRHNEIVAWHTSEYGDSRRLIHGHEEVKAGSLRQRIDKEWSLQSNSLNMYAEVTVTIGGERIRLG